MQQSAIRILTPRHNGFIDSWLQSLSKHTRTAYSSDIAAFWLWFGAEDVSLVTREDCHRWLGSLKATDLRPASINRKLAAVRGMLVEAVRYGIRPDNPFVGIKGFKASGISTRTNVPTVDQVVALMGSIGNETLIDVRDRAVIYLAGGLGMRREEIVDVTLDSLQQTQGKTVLTIVGKGSKTRRNALDPNPNLLDAVRQWIARGRIRPGAALIQGVVHGKANGRALHPSSIYAIIDKRLAAAGLAGFHPHSFRGFFITEALKECDIYKVQRAVGHSDPRTTQGYDQARDDVEDSASGYVRI